MKAQSRKGQVKSEEKTMGPNSSGATVRLRPHHIFCTPAITRSVGDRGELYQRVVSRLREILQSQPEAVVEVAEGVDELCQVCPLRVGSRCESPNGNEDKVRKWDALVRAGLDLHTGDILTVRDIQARLKEKGPLELCQRCQWGFMCRRGPKIKDAL